MVDGIRENDLVFNFSPTQEKFVYSEAHIVQLIGPMGEGKTFAAMGGLMAHAARCGMDIRGALVRDTHTNIKISTAPDIHEIFKDFVTFHDDYKKMIIHSTPKVEMDLFGIDDPASLSKLQAPQYAVIWLEEPCPIVEKANAGLPKDVLQLAIVRASRQQGRLMRVQITHNPGEEEHWAQELAMAPRIYFRDPISGLELIKETFRIPSGENKHLNPISRVAIQAAFKDDPAKLSRYAFGVESSVVQGKKVVRTYNSQRHFVSDKELDVIPASVGVRFWDSYQHPACVIGQIVSPHRLIIHDVCYDEGIGIKELITNQVKPLLFTSKYKDKISTWRDIGDPSMATADQSTINQSSKKTVEELLGGSFEEGPTLWQARIDPAISAFNENALDGNPKIILSKTAYMLHRGLNGGWHWKTDNSGNITGSTPVKNKFSHMGDALLYGIAIIFPGHTAKDRYGELRRIMAANKMARAMEYAHSNSNVVGF